MSFRRFLPQETAQLAEDCMDNYLTRDQIHHALAKIGVNRGFIPESPSLLMYYTNVINFLWPRNLLYKWLSELAFDPDRPEKGGFVFVVNWISKCQKTESEVQRRQIKVVLEKMLRPGEDLLKPVSWLANGLKAVQSVARIQSMNDGGTCFLIANNMIMTNHHVIESEEIENFIVKFDYNDLEDSIPQPISLNKSSLLYQSSELDFTIIQIPEQNRPILKINLNVNLETKPPAYILQHAKQGKLQLTINNNTISQCLEGKLHYNAATFKGSSGAPVCNDNWEVVGLNTGYTEEADKNWGRTISQIIDVLQQQETDVAKKILEEMHKSIVS